MTFMLSPIHTGTHAIPVYLYMPGCIENAVPFVVFFTHKKSFTGANNALQGGNYIYFCWGEG